MGNSDNWKVTTQQNREIAHRGRSALRHATMVNLLHGKMRIPLEILVAKGSLLLSAASVAAASPTRRDWRTFDACQIGYCEACAGSRVVDALAYASHVSM